MQKANNFEVIDLIRSGTSNDKESCVEIVNDLVLEDSDFSDDEQLLFKDQIKNGSYRHSKESKKPVVTSIDNDIDFEDVETIEILQEHLDIPSSDEDSSKKQSPSKLF